VGKGGFLFSVKEVWKWVKVVVAARRKRKRKKKAKGARNNQVPGSRRPERRRAFGPFFRVRLSAITMATLCGRPDGPFELYSAGKYEGRHPNLETSPKHQCSIFMILAAD
jgi:hypothetical protein